MAQRLTRDEFDVLVEAVRRWHPGQDAAVPAVADIDATVTAAALAQSHTGQVIALGRPWPVEPAVDNLRPAMQYMAMTGDTLWPGDVEPTGYMDFIGVAYHGKTVSHIDAFNHIAYRGKLFGGVDAAHVTHARGMSAGDVTIYGPLVTRGVLLDMADVAGLAWTEPGHAWTLAEIQQALASTGTTLRTGDALLFRSGHDRRRAELGPWDADAAAAGVHVSAIPWLIEQGVRIFGADGETDVRPSPVEGVTLPVHVLTLTMAGIPLLDNLALEDLGNACRQHGQSTFTLSVSPLNIPGGTGSPVNPVAIL
ncbi:MAG: cyclase family protein [Beutenbergiaceae bacterium]